MASDLSIPPPPDGPAGPPTLNGPVEPNPNFKNPFVEHSAKPIPNPLKPEHPESTLFLTLIRAAITIPVVLIWVVIGLYIWIPLLVRRTISYISAVVASAITRDTDAVVSSGINLEHSISFFFDGFVLIAQSLGMTGRHLDEQNDRGSVRAKEEFIISTLIWIIFAMVWLITALLLEAF